MLETVFECKAEKKLLNKSLSYLHSQMLYRMKLITVYLCRLNCDSIKSVGYKVHFVNYYLLEIIILYIIRLRIHSAEMEDNKFRHLLPQEMKSQPLASCKNVLATVQ